MRIPSHAPPLIPTLRTFRRRPFSPSHTSFSSHISLTSLSLTSTLSYFVPPPLNSHTLPLSAAMMLLVRVAVPTTGAWHGLGLDLGAGGGAQCEGVPPPDTRAAFQCGGTRPPRAVARGRSAQQRLVQAWWALLRPAGLDPARLQREAGCGAWVSMTR
jgi:hypothetical protein